MSELKSKEKKSRFPFGAVAGVTLVLFGGEQALQLFYPVLTNYIHLINVLIFGGVFYKTFVAPYVKSYSQVRGEENNPKNNDEGINTFGYKPDTHYRSSKRQQKAGEPTEEKKSTGVVLDNTKVTPKVTPIDLIKNEKGKIIGVSSSDGVVQSFESFIATKEAESR